ncbi:hypothetical protein [Enemella evansiae]|uniref:hypothetical protein n=1 Tax=Enemella evansiae TaxID=2016499 RepID=UPI00117F7AFA|nr:hypothetical protein [Enemella evansiae]
MTHEEVDWSALRAIGDSTAESVPAAIVAMMMARDTESAERAYWRIDNHVVVQGRLFQSAEFVADRVISEICAGRYSEFGLPEALNLLVQFAYGFEDASEIARGNKTIARNCRRSILKELDCIKNLIPGAQDEWVIRGVLDLVEDVEPDLHKQKVFLSTLNTQGWPVGAIRHLETVNAELREKLGGDPSEA